MTKPREQRTILAQGLEQVNARLADIPPDKKGALVVAVEWKYGVPFATFGTAMRVGDTLLLGAEAETRFTQLSTRAHVYAAWTW